MSWNPAISQLFIPKHANGRSESTMVHMFKCTAGQCALLGPNVLTKRLNPTGIVLQTETGLHQSQPCALAKQHAIHDPRTDVLTHSPLCRKRNSHIS